MCFFFKKYKKYAMITKYIIKLFRYKFKTQIGDNQWLKVYTLPIQACEMK